MIEIILFTKPILSEVQEVEILNTYLIYRIDHFLVVECEHN